MRRSHLKSRAGCKICKSRKIKCDEAPGTCGPCKKSRRRCSYADDPSSAQTSSTSTSSKEGAAYSALDLELLHNFTQNTVLTISNNPELQRFYQTEVVQKGFEHDYLLHGVLSLSAFHRAHEIKNRQKQAQDVAGSRDSESLEQDLSPPESQSSMSTTISNEGSSQSSPALVEKYLIKAYEQQNIALRGLREALTSFEASSPYIFNFQALLVLTTMGRPRDNPQHPDDYVVPQAPLHRVLSRILEVFYLVRGMHEIMHANQAYSRIREGPMGKILRTSVNLKTANDAEADAALANVCDAIREHSSPESTEMWISVADKLQETFSIATGYTDMSLPYFSPPQFPPEFISALENNTPEALVLLSYWAVLLYTVRWSWINEGWPELIIGAIAPVLNDTWRRLLRWPAEKMGLKLEDLVATSSSTSL